MVRYWPSHFGVAPNGAQPPQVDHGPAADSAAAAEPAAAKAASASAADAERRMRIDDMASGYIILGSRQLWRRCGPVLGRLERPSGTRGAGISADQGGPRGTGADRRRPAR